MVFSEEQKNEFREAFKVFDKNGDGSITSKELGSIMKAVGHNPTEAELKMMIAEVDEDGNGCIEFTEFCTLVEKHMNTTNDPEQELLEAFKVFDKDGNGTIDADELREVLVSFGERLTQRDVNDMIKQADKNGDGVIDYAEFCAMMSSK